MSNKPPKSDPPLFKLDELEELKDLGFDANDANEISVVTALAIVKDQKTSSSNDSKSFLSLQMYIREKFGHHDRRITKLERLAFAFYVVAGAFMAALEIYRTLKSH